MGLAPRPVGRAGDVVPVPEVTSPEETPDLECWPYGPIWWVELKDGRLRNYSIDPECRDWVAAFYEHPVGMARSFGYCGA